MRIVNTSEDIFLMPKGDHAAVCVTTNGCIKRNGHAVMGAGIAKQADDLFHIAPELGERMQKYGNRCYKMGPFVHAGKTYAIITFPTKHDWRDNSDLDLIIKSCCELLLLCELSGYDEVYLTPPGCGLGNLDWEGTVRPAIEHMLDDRFTIVMRQNA